MSTMERLQQQRARGLCSCIGSSSNTAPHRMQQTVYRLMHTALSTKNGRRHSNGAVQQSGIQSQLTCLSAHSFLQSSAQPGIKQHHGLAGYRGGASAASITKAAAAAAAIGDSAPADPCLQLSGDPARSVGALLGAMCGNALGAQVEPEKHYRLTRLFPFGYSDMSWSLDLSANPLPPGHVTGDFLTMLAVGQSLVTCGRANALDIAAHMAGSYQPGSPAKYSPYTGLALEGLAAGTNPFMLAAHVEGYMQVTPSRASQSCSHRPDRQLHGSEDFTAVLRAVPVALAYRDVDARVLREAVDAAVVFTHPAEQGREGAQAVAAALAWLIRADPSTARPQELLSHLLQITTSADMLSKLQLLQQDLPAVAAVGRVTNWAAFWRSQEWNQIVGTTNRLSKQNLAMQGTQAAAVALWLQLVNWQQPQQAVMMAASLGGYAGTTAAVVGAFAGGLHGCEWVPSDWWQQLQDDTLLEQMIEYALQQEEAETDSAAQGADSTAASAIAEKDMATADGEAEAQEQEYERSQAAKQLADLKQAEGITAAAMDELKAGADAAIPASTTTADAAGEGGDKAAATALQKQTATVAKESEMQQQQQQQSADYEVAEEADLLRVGKYAVVVMGHELAGLQPLAEQNQLHWL